MHQLPVEAFESGLSLSMWRCWVFYCGFFFRNKRPKHRHIDRDNAKKAANKQKAPFPFFSSVFSLCLCASVLNYDLLCWIEINRRKLLNRSANSQAVYCCRRLLKQCFRTLSHRTPCRHHIINQQHTLIM